MTEIEHHIEIEEQLDTNSSTWMADHKPIREASTNTAEYTETTPIQEEQSLDNLRNRIAAMSNALVAQRGQAQASEYLKKLVDLGAQEEGGADILKELHGEK